MSKIYVDNTEITVVEIEEKDYISLTDMVRNIDNGLVLIEKWLRNKNTIEFIGIWEEMYNPDFNVDGYHNNQHVMIIPVIIKSFLINTMKKSCEGLGGSTVFGAD